MRWRRLLWVLVLFTMTLALLGLGLGQTRAAPQLLTYPSGTTLTPLGAGQRDALARRAAYVALLDGIWRRDPLDWSATPASVTVVLPPVSPGAVTGLPAGAYDQVVGSGDFAVPRAYALHPRRVAVFYPELRDAYDQIVGWEASAYEQLFRLYLDHSAFDLLSEAQINTETLASYDALLLPAVRVGWAEDMAEALGSESLAALRSFVDGGGFLYAQGNAAWLVEAAGLIPSGSVDLDTRVTGTDNRGPLTVAQPEHPLAFSWLSPSLYVLDEPALYNQEVAMEVIATFSGTSAPDTVAIAVAEVGDGRVVLVNGHPTGLRTDAPQVLDVLLWAMAERGGLNAHACQAYNPELPCEVIPAYEPGVGIWVTSTFRNTWDGPLSAVRVTETVSADFVVPTATITPEPSAVIATNEGGTRIVWDLASAAPGYHDFIYLAVTAAPSGTTGGLLSTGEASFVDPFWTTSPHPEGLPRAIQRAKSTVSANMPARLVGDRDIELDVIYPLPASGWYFDIALTLENKEETDAENVRITDVVALISPIVDVWDQRMIPHVISDSISPSGTTALSQTLWAINEIFFYDTPVPIYPMPDQMDGVADTGALVPGVKYGLDTWLQGPRHVYTFTGPFTTTLGYDNSVFIPPGLSEFITLTAAGDLHLPALEMNWEFGTLPGYDYLEPAVRYGLWSHETFQRPVYFASDPHPPALILETGGGSVFTNLGGHPIPYEEYLSHGIIAIPQGHTLPRVSWEDIWERQHEMTLRTVFYDIVPFPPPEFHAVVNTTYEIRVDQDGDGLRETRVLEYPSRREADLNLMMKSYSNFHPDMPPLQKDETMIDQGIFRGLGFEIHPANGTWWESWRPLHLQGYLTDTDLITIVTTPAYDHLYFQQYLESQQREAWVISATLSVPEPRHYEGRVKVDDGARFVYHQKAAGPSRYEVFDAHTLVAFGHSADATIDKAVAPVVVATYSDTLYHLLRVEDPWDPRDPGWGPFIRSYGFGDVAATTYVGGRLTDTLLFGRVEPGDSTQIRVSIRNNQTGITVTNLAITPQPPAGITVTMRPPTVTESIAPIFFDFPFLHTTSISDGWRSVWYYDVRIDPDFADTGEVVELPFAVKAEGLPDDFEIPPAQLAMMTPSGDVTTVWGQAVGLAVGDAFPESVTPGAAFFATPAQAFALEEALDKADMDTAASLLEGLLPVTIATEALESGTWVTFTLPSSPTLDATMMPWWEAETPHGAYYLVLRSEVNIERHGRHQVNNGPVLSYHDDFDKLWLERGAPTEVNVQGAWLEVTYNVDEVGPACASESEGFVPKIENEAELSVDITNMGDDVAQGTFITLTFGAGVTLESSDAPPLAKGDGWASFWLGDMAPGQQRTIQLVLSGIPEPPPATIHIDARPSAAHAWTWQLIQQTAGHFEVVFQAALRARIVAVDRVLAGELRVGPGRLPVYLPVIMRSPDWWPTQ